MRRRTIWHRVKRPEQLDLMECLRARDDKLSKYSVFLAHHVHASTKITKVKPLQRKLQANYTTVTYPLVHDALAKFFNICNLPLVVDPLLHDSPYQ